MQQISRKQVEKWITRSDVIATAVEQNKKEISILFTLANNCSFVVKYDTLNKEKSYFMECATAC